MDGLRPLIGEIANQLFTQLRPLVIQVGPTLLGLLLLATVLPRLLAALRPRLRGWSGERRVARVLDRHCLATCHDRLLADGRGGWTQIDHLALTAETIWVIETKHFGCHILGRAHEARWTQRCGRNQHDFQNPLRQNHAHLQAVRARLGDAHQPRGLVVFSGRASFARGRPAGVTTLAELPEVLGASAGQSAPIALQLAWEDLLDATRDDKSTRRAHLDQLTARHGCTTGRLRRRVISLLGLIGLALTILGWQSLTQPWRMPVTAPERLVAPAPAPTPTPRSQHVRATVDQPSTRSSIDWSHPESVETEACKLAIISVLIEDTAETRRQRAAACDKTTATP
ncbi:nuclease-related domain-containing protein [Marichromatium gracile]|uniref:Nuclease-like protein n=1 Tax=Marichromatium gracile TaxID=1048 RepID=A0A4R4A5M6_MARGR|nr:nuclease-related domain-containing protein [Marichromatium gracile]MBK1709471.1 hypothetical protein [Marichromatium gracile]TCW33206.1 nuclease-like protein [Marichromatium gracile]